MGKKKRNPDGALLDSEFDGKAPTDSVREFLYKIGEVAVADRIARGLKESKTALKVVTGPDGDPLELPF